MLETSSVVSIIDVKCEKFEGHLEIFEFCKEEKLKEGRNFVYNKSLAMEDCGETQRISDRFVVIMSKFMRQIKNEATNKERRTSTCAFCRKYQRNIDDKLALSSNHDECDVMTSHDITSRGVTTPTKVDSKDTGSSSKEFSIEKSASSTRLGETLSLAANRELSELSGLSPTRSPRKHRRIGTPTRISTSFCTLSMISMVLFLLTRSAQGVWWSPGSDSNLVESSRVCRWALQAGGPQRKMCQTNMPLVEQIQKGIEKAVESCQHEFRNDRWNCSQSYKEFFARTTSQDIRENSFLQALTSAAITYEVASACARGDIEECGYKNNVKLKTKFLRLEAAKKNLSVSHEKLRAAVDQFNWGGSNEDVEYGIEKSRQFLNFTRVGGYRRRGAIRAKIKSHNQDAGRAAIKNYRKRKCECHGLSGSCTIWTCWKNMPRFPEIRIRLRRRYDTAVRMVSGNDGTTLNPARRRYVKRRRTSAIKRRPRSTRSERAVKTESGNRPNNKRRRRRPQFRRRKRGMIGSKIPTEALIFTQKSPSFCFRSRKLGSLGTRGRLCDPNLPPRTRGSCSYLCCGRGYRTEQITITKSCNCHFKFCCNVTCDECVTHERLHLCL